MASSQLPSSSISSPPLWTSPPTLPAPSIQTSQIPAPCIHFFSYPSLHFVYTLTEAVPMDKKKHIPFYVSLRFLRLRHSFATLTGSQLWNLAVICYISLTSSLQSRNLQEPSWNSTFHQYPIQPKRERPENQNDQSGALTNGEYKNVSGSFVKLIY